MKFRRLPQGFGVRLGRRELVALAVLAIVGAAPGVLSTEQLTLTTYYPSPYGVYTQLRSRNDAYLATAAGGRVGVGTNAPGANGKLDVRGGALVDNLSVGHTNSPSSRIDLRNGDLVWADGRSRLQTDQGGSIELGGSGTGPSGTPYIDFHYVGSAADYSARLINVNNGVHVYGGGTELGGYFGNSCRMVAFAFGATTSCPTNWTVSAYADAGGIMFNSPGGASLTPMPINGQMLCCKLQSF